MPTKIFLIALYIFHTPTFSAPIAVQDSIFPQGQYWIWEYRNHIGDINSWEKYQVTSHNNKHVTIEMSTKFPNEINFQTHHKMIVNLNKCLRSYKNPIDKKPWRLSGFYYRDGSTWKKSG